MKQAVAIVALALSALACALAAPAEPTADIAAIQTEAAQTAVAGVHHTETAAVPTATRKPRATPKPTSTPQPTLTPTETLTPKPTITNTPEPKPIVLTGSGDDVVDVPKWSGPALARASYQGDDNFIVYNYDADNNKIGLVFNGLYSYHGTRLIDARDGEETARLQIQTSGDWTIEILKLGSAPILKAPGTYKGEDDAVILLSGATPDLLKYNAQEESNFIIQGLDENTRRSRLIVNEIGPVEGSAILPAGTILLEVHARGEWSVEITER